MKKKGMKQLSKMENAGKVSRKRTRKDYYDSLYDIEYISRMVESMEFQSSESGLLDELLEDDSQWD